ncbi:transposase [Aliiruegeria lutimaris]|uniref:Transposase, Mutator family n=1 Tax=Aliiruegeria lutimaris TaxID=571298 RepID=A0A1G9JWY9_9RHOB|nr:transposase [Aliiruegeria lutimaris]SDL41393.1 Transposase, Mutator family [Aliiruegeria lutimaris]
MAPSMARSERDRTGWQRWCSPCWKRTRSTNPLERMNREIKLRADVIGIFPNEAVIIRLVGALMLRTYDEWTVARRFISL